MPTSRRIPAFTLVELLVVIAIVGVLVAVLLPSLGKAREAAYRVKCMSNLHQQHIGVMVYAHDHEGSTPYEWNDSDFDGSYATAETQYTVRDGSRTAWMVFHKDGYMDNKLFTCPSQKEPAGYGNNDPGLHYGYRYNSQRTLSRADHTVAPYGSGDFTRPKSGLLFDEERSQRALLTDAAHARRGKDEPQRIVLENINYFERAWGHKDGGNVAAHDGRVIWLENIAPHPTKYNYVPGWPRRHYTWYGTGWRGRHWGPSLDEYMQGERP